MSMAWSISMACSTLLLVIDKQLNIQPRWGTKRSKREKWHRLETPNCATTGVIFCASDLPNLRSRLMGLSMRGSSRCFPQMIIWPSILTSWVLQFDNCWVLHYDHLWFNWGFSKKWNLPLSSIVINESTIHCYNWAGYQTIISTDTHRSPQWVG